MRPSPPCVRKKEFLISDHRKDDPYDAAFFEHVDHLSTLESLNIISTKFNDDWMPPLAKLTHLKVLRFTNNGKLTDAGMAQSRRG